MSDEIPFHVQEQIIKRLPVVSLLQFRSVSKAWKSLIDSSKFIAAHSVTQSQHLLLRYEDQEFDTVGNHVSFVDDDTFPEQRFVHTLPHSVTQLKQSNIVGSSLGLLCFHGYNELGENFCPNMETETIVLWNPSIRKSITVPMPNKCNQDPETDLGFGVSPVTSDPTIVEITQFHKTSYHCEAKVYTVSSGKWRNLSSNVPSKPFRVFWPQVVVDRFIYWCAFDPLTMDNGLPNHNVIMSFDITNESFGVVELPDSLRRLSPTQLCISKVRDSLVMLEYDSFVKRACGVWMMENGVEKSFTKRFNVEAPPYWSKSITTLGFRKSGQPIMEVEIAHDFYEQSQLVVYEPNFERFNYHEIYGKPETFSVHSYIETLVLMGSIEVEDDGHIATCSI
ncbi:putative F-box protein At1g47790 [Lactuca sativa]|uniref:F-box domain-containing protein n=1 Tax=Lactuca sativa TaxID=4236 RepID=A0A9R1WJG8_LACSA|nr:putative F-box protein At1g47790 [Lactuca sativa]KAJ0223785.1 hypothetical protein LSAT_V11C200054570 [Lactuca sativa]